MTTGFIYALPPAAIYLRVQALHGRGADGWRGEIVTVPDDVIPGWCGSTLRCAICTSGKSRDSGFDASHRPGMTRLQRRRALATLARQLSSPFVKPALTLKKLINRSI